MKSRMLIGVIGGVFTLIVFGLGFFSAFLINYSAQANTYTKEHVDNGRFMLQALKNIEEGNVEQARLFLRGQVSAKVLIVDSIKTPLTSDRDVELIENFYSDVIQYFDSQGGFNETMQVMENGVWVTKPTPTMEILKEFSEK
ncbi:hypothetical protein [Alteromonas sp. 14N.309.X.WAT.G.H12]|uniref:hypothetical protein n=1 Tax=Alteromonas sp. 14N.309.X.WAT.G.H12 TaxID=3120824 RepID=UPI002FD08579